MAMWLSHPCRAGGIPRGAPGLGLWGERGMPAESSRREFLRRAGVIALAAPGAAVALDACSSVATSAKASTIRVGWAIEPDTMNPLTTYSTEAVEVLQLVYDNLIHYDLQLKPEPGLASSWSYSADGKSITYKLRSAKWHDGKPFTSADAKFSFDVIQSKQVSQYAQWVTNLTSTEAPDASTLVLHFSKPQAFNPGIAVPILPAHIWQNMSAADIQKFANAKPVGTGPYKFVNWKKGQSIEIARNDGWWGTKPAAQKITWILFQNEDVMTQSLRTGAVDICPEIPPTIWEGLKGAQNVKPVSLQSFSFHHIGINVSDNPKSGGNPLLKDLAVRQALSYAVDRQQLVNVALAGHGLPGGALLPAGFGEWHLDIPADKQLNANPAKAEAVLDAAGYKLRGGSKVRTSAGGKPLSFRLIAIESTSVDVAAAQLLRNACAKVGIQLTLTTLDANSLGSTVYNSKAPSTTRRHRTGTSSSGAGTRGSTTPTTCSASCSATRSARTTTSTTATATTTSSTTSRRPSSTTRPGSRWSTRRSSTTTTPPPTSSCGTRPSCRATGPTPGKAGPR